MKLRFCSCRQCKYGRRRHGNSKKIRALRKSARAKTRRQLKHAIRTGDYFVSPPTSVGVGYTD